MAAGIAAGILSALLLSGCAAGPAASPSAPTVPLRVSGTPGEATVTVDDQRVGSLALVQSRGMRIPPGRHRVSVEAPGYLPFDAAFDAKDEIVALEVKLVPVPE
jgi:hypothetical protein